MYKNLTATQVDEIVEKYIPKEAYSMVKHEVPVKFVSIPSINSFGDCVYTQTPMPPAQEQQQPANKKGNTMYCDCCDCEICTAQMLIPEKRILLDRVSEEQRNHDVKINKAFRILDQETPETLEDFTKRIKDGKYVLTDDMADRTLWIGSMYSYIRWRDPEAKADQEGAKVARKKLEEEATRTRDTITVSDPKDGLKALHKFVDSDFTK